MKTYLAVFTLFLAVGLHAQNTLLIKNVNLWDGTSNALKKRLRCSCG